MTDPTDKQHTHHLLDLAALSDPTDSHSLAELRQHLWNGDDLVSHCRCEVCDDYVASHSLREVFQGDESWLACIPCWEYETGRSGGDGA